MGTVITHTELVENHSHSAIDNAVEAGIRCIQNAGVAPEQIGVLINAGVFRDDNIMEPSIASLIQSQVKLGLDFSEDAPDNYCFSFDVINGACSLLNAVQVADSLLKNNSAQYVLIVAGDCHPSKQPNADFPFLCVGSAMLLEHNNDPSKGFQTISYLSASNDEESTLLCYGDLNQFGSNGRSHALFEMGENHIDACLSLAQSHLKDYLSQHPQAHVDYLIGNDLEPGFSRKICDEIAPTKDTQVIDLNTIFNGDVHTSSCIVGYNFLMSELINPEGTTVLFSSVGSGNASICALYQL